MTDATDIITYVGVPLAVLGVLPILYTFAIAVLNQRRIRNALLRHGHRPVTTAKQQDGFTIRSSPMTTLIEVELPKYAIAPLDRHDDEYWQLSHDSGDGLKEVDRLLERHDSSLSTIEEGRVKGFLRGGSWRAFHWKKLIVGKKLYRIQYEDELREPPAEVDFSDLIHFLLDWGAELDPMGWEKLRSGGLWTPAGTVLLNMPGLEEEDRKIRREWVLRTSMPDEGDGILTLSIKWPSMYPDVESTRGAASLPPGWGRLIQPQSHTSVEEDEVAKRSSDSDLAARIEAFKVNDKSAANSTSMRFKTESGLISKVYWELANVETTAMTDLTHLHSSKLPLSQAWFTTAVSSLLLAHPSSSTTGTLWGFNFPAELSNFARKDTIPVGIMVLLEILANDKAPQWTSLSSNANIDYNAAHEHRIRFEASRAAERLEAAMPPEQARVARMNREMSERRRAGDDLMKLTQARRERETRRFADALASSKMDNSAVADLCLAWLKEKHEIPAEYSLYEAVESILYLLVLDRNTDPFASDSTSAPSSSLSSSPDEGTTSAAPTSTPRHEEQSEAHRILKIIDEWNRWANAGGMMREQFLWLSAHKRDFCSAACVVAVVREGALRSMGQGHKGQGRASLDMIECLDMWRKVRLG